MRNKLIYAVVVVITILAVGLTGFYSGYQQGYKNGLTQSENEFYRGGYAICMWFATNIFYMPPDFAMAACLNLVTGARESDAYHDYYPGYTP